METGGQEATSKPKTEAQDSPKTSDAKNRGWPKGKKRYPKSPGAPKQPLSGYVHFLNDRRETVRKEAPDMSFADISKKLANEWSQLGQEDKQKYAERAELDKERYSREFQEYQQTDDYKEFIAQQNAAKEANGEAKSSPTPSKKSKKSKKKDKEGAQTPATPLVIEDSRSNNSSSLDIPIFREEFLELNKSRETELRSLRKTVSEFEEQNAVLQKHVDNMKSAVSKLERDISITKENSSSLERQLNAVKNIVLTHFSQLQVPASVGSLTKDNVEEYVVKVLEAAQENPHLRENIKKITENLDLSSMNVAS